MSDDTNAFCKRLPVCLVFVTCALHMSPANAQQRDLDFDRTESWAMAHTTVATLFQGAAPPGSSEPWQLTLSGELVTIPHVSRADSFVGFNGTKFEDLNKSPVFGRGRLAVGLPLDFTFELAYTPPLEVDGAKPDGIYGVALERPIFSHGRWRLGGRAFLQAGEVKADVTCPQSVVDFGLDDTVNNPFGCVERSRDIATIDHYGAELSLAAAISPRLDVWGAFSVTRLEPEVQVNALLVDGPDLTLLRTQGTVRTPSLGAGYWFADRWQLAGSVNYTQLEVRRPPDRIQQNDDSFNIRVALSYRLR